MTKMLKNGVKIENGWKGEINQLLDIEMSENHNITKMVLNRFEETLEINIDYEEEPSIVYSNISHFTLKTFRDKIKRALRRIDAEYLYQMNDYALR